MGRLECFMKVSKWAVALIVIMVAVPGVLAAATYTSSSFLGSVKVEVKRYEAVDLGWYEHTALFIPIPQNVSMAAIQADVSKNLSNSGSDTLALGLWVADSSGKIIALLDTEVREVENAYKKQIFVDPWRNTPAIQCASTRLYPLIKDQIRNGGYAAATFTPEDFEPALRLLGKSAGELTVVGIYPLSKTHLYTRECTVISARTSGLYSLAGLMITSANINGVEYKAEGGVIRLDGPISGTVTLNLWGRILFLPISRTVTVQL
jgi:hypothetical protein